MGFLGVLMLTIITFVSVVLGAWILLSDYKSRTNLWFTATAIAIIAWNVFAYLGYNSLDTNLSVVFFRLNFAAVSLFFMAFYRFALYFPIKYDKDTKLVDLLVTIICILFALSSVATDWIIQSVSIPGIGNLTVNIGFLGNLFYAFSIALTIYVVGLIVKKSMAFKDKSRRARLSLFITGTLIFAILNVIFSIGVAISFPNNYSYTQFGDFSAIFFLGFTAYAIVRHQLFDVKFTIIRSVSYFMVLVVMAGVYFAVSLPVSLWITGKSIDVWQTISNAFVALLLAFSFQPLKRFFDKITNRIFYKDRYHTDEFYSRLNDALTLNTNLRGILKRASKEIASTLKCQQVFFFVNKMDGQYVSEGTMHHNHLSKDDATKISEYFGNNYHAIAVSTMDPENPIRNLLLNLGIEILIPLVQADETVGYLCLGENMSTGYTGRDIKVLNIITDEIVIAVQNALAVQKIFDFNSTLQKKVRDATKELRIKNTQLKQLDKAKDEFVSVAAHELRTPMTVFRGFVNLMLRKSLGPITLKQKDVLDKMNDNTKNLIDMVNNMLDLSKLEANKLVITLSDNYLDEMISETFDKIAFLYSSKGVELKREGDNVSINTDPEKFERVLLNLLSNAYKFTPVGGSVSVITSIDNAASEAVICVSDTGVGIPEDGIAKLFKKFSQVENALQKMSAGTGLGLSICKQMVEKMNGKIWVESQVGIGSKFYFTMPLSKTDTQN